MCTHNEFYVQFSEIGLQIRVDGHSTEVNWNTMLKEYNQDEPEMWVQKGEMAVYYKQQLNNGKKNWKLEQQIKSPKLYVTCADCKWHKLYVTCADCKWHKLYDLCWL